MDTLSMSVYSGTFTTSFLRSTPALLSGVFVLPVFTAGWRWALWGVGPGGSRRWLARLQKDIVVSISMPYFYEYVFVHAYKDIA